MVVVDGERENTWEEDETYMKEREKRYMVNDVLKKWLIVHSLWLDFEEIGHKLKSDLEFERENTWKKLYQGIRRGWFST